MENPSASIQNYKDDFWVFQVKKSWKGIEKEYVAVDLDTSHASPGGTCPWLMPEKKKDYLIFAYGTQLKVVVECSDSRQLTDKYDWTTEEISRLNSFWFRTKARLWRF